MGGTLVIEIALILLLMVANGFFAASEIAVVSSRKGRLEQQAKGGSGSAAAALALAENPNRFLSTVQVGITLIGTFAAAFGGDRLSEPLADFLRASVPALAASADVIALTLVVLAITYFSLIVGELVPKRLALQNAEGIASAVAPPMTLLARLASPVVSFLTASTELVLRLLGRHNVAEQPITEDDIIALVEEGREGGTVEASERDIIANVFTFSDRTVRSVMTPRAKMVALTVDTPLSQALTVVNESGYSRIPVYDGTPDQIVGVLHVKDLLRSWGTTEQPTLRTIMRPAVFVPEMQRAALVLQQLRQRHVPLAIVLDEYGQTAGLITLEDLIEELVGDIGDEYDEIGEGLVRRDDGSYLVDGSTDLTRLDDLLDLPEADTFARVNGIETVAGLVLTLLGHIPRSGELAAWQGYRFEVVDMDGQRIDKVLVVPLPPEGAAQSRAALATGAVLPPPVTPDGASVSLPADPARPEA